MFSKYSCLSIGLFLTLSLSSAWAQKIAIEASPSPDLLYQVKNIEDFVDRFNFQPEIPDGTQNNHSNEKYARKQFIESLFYQTDLPIDTNLKPYPILKSQFIEEVISQKYLFHKDSNLYCRVACTFLFEKQNIPIILIMRYIHDEDNAFRWVINDVESEKLMIPQEIDISNYLSPTSDNLNFISFKKVMKSSGKTIDLTSPEFRYNSLSVFLFLIETNQLVFIQSHEMEYLYYGIPGWEIRLREYPQKRYNSGWLISNIRKI